ncbi:MAG: hypothetical protein M1834_000087 [Cirrosporium novae-zelandiae]|nr:MAG: hypothetical protein M1834_000087 [Cirrosporium novae-zelandiae]
MASATIQRPRVFLDIQVGPEYAGRIIIELFIDKTPKTCDNFRALCTSSYTPPNSSSPLTYALSPFHRIIDEFMIQGGDITSGNGTGGQSIYASAPDETFEDENLEWRGLDAKGLVCMANRGPNTNTSQFFITLDECSHLNGRHTVFGHVVGGMEVVDQVAKIKAHVIDEEDPTPPLPLHSRKKKGQKAASTTPRQILNLVPAHLVAVITTIIATTTVAITTTLLPVRKRSPPPRLASTPVVATTTKIARSAAALLHVRHPILPRHLPAKNRGSNLDKGMDKGIRETEVQVAINIVDGLEVQDGGKAGARGEGEVVRGVVGEDGGGRIEVRGEVRRGDWEVRGI